MSGPSSEQFEAAVIGGRAAHDKSIDLVEYDLLWPELFDREAVRIREALGPAALAVEHVGSTSVPGLAAKPIIVHVFSTGRAEIDRMLSFRDHPRRDDGDRRLYEETKRELASGQWKYVQHYANAKSDVVEQIRARASRTERYVESDNGA